MEDLLGSEIGKNDYDWLLTPPGTPRVPALEVAEKTPSSNILPKRTTTRSSSTTRASRLSISQTENGHSTVPTRPARSNSVSRPSIQSALMNGNNRTSVLNTSISSVTNIVEWLTDLTDNLNQTGWCIEDALGELTTALNISHLQVSNFLHVRWLEEIVQLAWPVRFYFRCSDI